MTGMDHWANDLGVTGKFALGTGKVTGRAGWYHSRQQIAMNWHWNASLQLLLDELLLPADDHRVRLGQLLALPRLRAPAPRMVRRGDRRRVHALTDCTEQPLVAIELLLALALQRRAPPGSVRCASMSSAPACAAEGGDAASEAAEANGGAADSPAARARHASAPPSFGARFEKVSRDSRGRN